MGGDYSDDEGRKRVDRLVESFGIPRKSLIQVYPCSLCRGEPEQRFVPATQTHIYEFRGLRLTIHTCEKHDMDGRGFGKFDQQSLDQLELMLGAIEALLIKVSNP